LKQAVVIENKAGASTMIGADFVAKAAPDGYTMLMASVTTLSINHHLYPNISYQPERDFAPVSMVAETPFYLLASPTLKVSKVSELIELARKNPGKFNYSTPGNGTSPHLVSELFTSLAGIDVIHVPYKSTSAAEVDLNAGRVQFAFTGSGAQAIRSGRVVGLGLTSEQPIAAMPELQPLKSQGVDLTAAVWNGIVVPTGTDPAIIAKLSKAIETVTQQAEVKNKLEATGAIVYGTTPEAFKKMIAEESARWGEVIKKANISVQ
ncbi:MAG: tripartite tricarboxylate transporter substrate binding protein, partial [Pigmentiphaga sp.]|nr:tripartite tricarboxylate transporter substrate binding protein [Pigmentiphaga sp.]